MPIFRFEYKAVDSSKNEFTGTGTLYMDGPGQANITPERFRARVDSGELKVGFAHSGTGIVSEVPKKNHQPERSGTPVGKYILDDLPDGKYLPQKFEITSVSIPPADDEPKQSATSVEKQSGS